MATVFPRCRISSSERVDERALARAGRPGDADDQPFALGKSAGAMPPFSMDVASRAIREGYQPGEFPS